MNKGVYSVSELNTYIKNIFDKDAILQHVKLEGELRDVKVYPSGHMYFSLIDKESSISAVMFASYREHLKFKPKDGDSVTVTGNVNVYIKNGKYQIYVSHMELSGEGAKLLALLKLKEKLFKEGLFDPSHKREINLYPHNIGLITAKGSAAESDLVTNIHRRYPLVNIYTFYSSVQGENAPFELIRALKLAYSYKLDTLIIGRGGGSTEDLDAFNNEELVRLAYKSPFPIIAAVGHEIDYTLLDYVADKRASTPTGAAELATVDKREIYETLDNMQSIMEDSILKRIQLIKDKLTLLSSRPFFKNPSTIYKDKLNEIKLIKESLNNAMKLYLSNKTSDLRSVRERLQGVNPKRVLDRGFALLKGKNGKIVKKVSEINVGEEIETTLSDGKLYANVSRKEKHV